MSKREEKYPDTSVFHYFNANPKINSEEIVW